jgi:hypothetical protein
MLRFCSTVGWAERSDAKHSDESQSLDFATLSANLQNFNIRNQPNLPRLACMTISIKNQYSFVIKPLKTGLKVSAPAGVGDK